VTLDRVFIDSASGRSTARPQLEALLAFVRDGDRDVNGELCARLGGALASVLMLDLGGLKADSADALGALDCGAAGVIRQMERTYTCERAAHARGGGGCARPAGGPPSPAGPGRAGLRRAPTWRRGLAGQIVAKTEMTRSRLYRYLPPPTAATDRC